VSCINEVIWSIAYLSEPNDFLGEIGNALRVHLDDSNLMVKLLCLQIVTKIAVGMGQPFQNHARNLATAVAAVCADQKVTTRTAALETLAVMSETCQGLDCMVPALAAAIEKPNPVLRGSVLGLIAAQFERYAPKADLTPLMPATLSSLEDRSGDVRKAAQAVLPFVVNSVGFDQVMNSVSKLKPASKSAVAPMVQAVRMSAVSTPAMSSTEPTRTAQPAETKPSLAKSVTKAAVNVPAASVPIKPEVPEVTKPRGMSMKSNALRTTSSDVAEHRLPAGASRTTIPGISAVKSRLALKRPVATTAEPARTDTTSAAPFHTSDMGPKSSREKRDLARWSYDVTNVAPQLEYLQKQMNDHASPELTGLLFSSDRFAEKDHLAGLALLDELYAADADSSPFGLTADQADTLQVANMDLVLKYVGVRLHDGSTQMILKCLDLVQRVIEIVDRGRGGFSEGESNVILPALIYRVSNDPSGYPYLI
jgi:cytoskeleton-associated protein 5